MQMQSGVGDSEKEIHAIFVAATKAAPSMVFFDEVCGMGWHGIGLDACDG